LTIPNSKFNHVYYRIVIILGHLSMCRQTVKDREDIRKKEKIEKRQQELLEQNPHHQNRNTVTIKYTKGLKHQVCCLPDCDN